jgi:hypothetical protein
VWEIDGERNDRDRDIGNRERERESYKTREGERGKD